MPVVEPATPVVIEAWLAAVTDDVRAASAPLPRLTLGSGHEGTVKQCRITSDGRYAISCGTEGGVRVWNVSTGDTDCTWMVAADS